MARKVEAQKPFNVAVVGLSGSEKDRGCMGVGKSCLCNRFVRPLADDYHTDHISVLSQTDFSGRVVNNDHWLYWGETTKTTEEGIDLQFSIIESTEFIDDSCFQPFKGGKTDPYFKRCAATRLCSAEKLMYICKNQLGIEKEYEQKYLPDGRFSVDGFVCVFDVSDIQGRTLEKAVEYTALILNNLMRTKKPVVLATTKQDEANEYYVKEAERLVNRKEFRGMIPMIETSAHENVNVDLPFLICAQLMDRTRGKAKILGFNDALRSRKEALDYASDAYQSLIRMQVTDYRTIWNLTYKKFSQSQDFLHYCDLFGQDAAHLTFKRHIKKLKDDYVGRKMQMYIRILPEVLGELVPDMDSIGENCDWDSVKLKVRHHPDFDQYFVQNPVDVPWQEVDLMETSDTRIPFDLLDTPEAEQCFFDHRTSLEGEDRRREMMHQFKQLLQETGYVTPGKQFNEVRVLFMGRECYESLSEQDLMDIYEEHQKEITERGKANFQELLQEHSQLFYHFASLGPGSVITQEDIFKITEALQEDVRYKGLDRLEQDRTLMLLRHLGFIHGPIREHCPAYPSCMDVLIEKSVSLRARRPSAFTRNSQWLSDGADNRHLSLVLLGSGGLGEELGSAIRKVNESFEIDKVRYTFDFRIIDGDVDLPQNSFGTNDFSPQGCFCIYSNHQTQEFLRDSFEKTLLSNLEEEDRLPFHGLPIVFLFAGEPDINEKDTIFLREEGENRAKSLQCPFIDVTNLENSDSEEQVTRFEDSLRNGSKMCQKAIASALTALVESIQRRAGSLNIYQSKRELPEEALNPDLRILLCMLCGDPYAVDQVVQPFLIYQNAYVTSHHTVTLEVTIGESRRFVEMVFTSYHGAQAYRDELLHGFLLVYSPKRKASLSTLSAFSNNIPNTPTQILAVTDSSANSNIYYSNHDLSHQLISEGNAIADKLQAHFLTTSAAFQQKTDFFTPFFNEVWERKPQIEKAFEMDDSDYSLERRTPVPPPIPSRQESYNIRAGSLEDGPDSEGIYEQLPSDRKSGEMEPSSPSPSPGYLGQARDRAPLSPSDGSEIYASVFGQQENGDDHLVKPSQIKNRRSLQAGYSAYPPPEPAPPDLPNSLLRKAPSLPASGRLPVQRSFDEGWVENKVYDRNLRPGEEWLDNDVYQSYQSDRHKMPPPLKPKPSKPKFDNITDAVGRLSVSQRQTTLPKSHAPLAAPEAVDIPPEYAQVKDALYGDRQDYSYAMVQNALTDSKVHRVRSLARRKENSLEKGSDSDSDWSSLERRQRESYAFSRGSRRAAPHKKIRKKRGIPVAPPRLPSFEGNSSMQFNASQYSGGSISGAGLHQQHRLLNASGSSVNADQARGDGVNSLSASDLSNDEEREFCGRSEEVESESQSCLNAKSRRAFQLKKRTKQLQSHSISETASGSPQSPTNSSFIPTAERSFSVESSHLLSYSSSSSKLKIDTSSLSCIHPAEDEYEVSSPREATIRQLGMILKSKSATVVTENDTKLKDKKEKERKKSKEDEKQEKRRLKEEERQKRIMEKKKRKQISKGGNSILSGPGLEEFVQSETNATPLFVEKCIGFVEEEGLDSEGIYRVPGNRAHVDLLFQKFDEDASLSIKELDIPVNAVATALKDFFSKRLPPLIPPAVMDELQEVASLQDRNNRLLALRELLLRLPHINFQVLKFVFQHFVRVTENSRLNSMDSKNLAICWWPTLLPFEFSDMMMFERMRPHLEESVQTMIDQFQFLFSEENHVLVV